MGAVKKAERLANWSKVAGQCAHMSKIGRFALVGLVSPDQDLDSEKVNPAPLWRSHKGACVF